MKKWREGMKDDIGFFKKDSEVDKEECVPWYIEALRHGVNLGEEMKMTEIKPCPFCGETPNVYGRKRRDYVNSIWADQEEEEYWVKPNCLPMCFLGNIHATAFGFVDGMKYRSPELAIKVWNERKGEQK